MKRRPDGRWQKQITLPNGKRKIIYSSAPTERTAVKEMNQIMLQYQKEHEDSILFESVAEKWKEEHFKSLTNNSLKAYKPSYASAVAFFKGYNISELKPLHINQYLKHLTSQGFAQKTIKNRLLTVSLICKYAVLNEYATGNPCFNISIPKNLPKTKRDKASTDDEIKIRNGSDSVPCTLAYLYLTTGLRRGEALALTPHDVDLENKAVTVSKTVEWIGNTPHIKNCPKTDAGVRTVPICDRLASLLSPLMKNKYIFQNEKGEMYSNSNFNTVWNLLKEEIDISCTPHQLRHSYATILFDAGIDIKTAQTWLGHADIKTTLDIYTHLSENKREESVKKLNDFLTTI